MKDSDTEPDSRVLISRTPPHYVISRLLPHREAFFRELSLSRHQCQQRVHLRSPAVVTVHISGRQTRLGRAHSILTALTERLLIDYRIFYSSCARKLGALKTCYTHRNLQGST